MILVILLGLTKQSVMAADVAVVHGATLALFLSFAANARSIVLNSNSDDAFNVLVRARLLLVLPLAVGSLLLAQLFSNILLMLAVGIILRRSAEWFAELAISEAERLQNYSIAIRFIVLDVVGLIGVTLSFVAGSSWSIGALFGWAVLPAVSGWALIHFSVVHAKTKWWNLSLIPHFGSSLVVGVTTYVFRVLIVLLVGKESGGNLFAAFSIGSMAGTAFSTGIGPTLLLQKRIGTVSSSRVVALASGLLAILGIVVFVALSGFNLESGSAREFWLATGCSLLGGSLMVQAQYYRLKQLQESPVDGVFPADILCNILAVTMLPFLYFVSGGKFLLAAYCLNAAIAFVIYWKTLHGRGTKILSNVAESRWLGVTYSLLLLPVFIQVGSGIFRDPAFLFDSGGSIMRLPLPVSVAACGIGYLLLKDLHRARFSLCLMFFAFMTLVTVGIGSTIEHPSNQSGKLILAIQFLLPMFAMPLGQLAGHTQVSMQLLARSFLYVLAFVVPAQLAATWLKSDMLLQPYLGLFSVYQHLQYVPVVFVSAYIICVFVLWHKMDTVQPERVILTAGGPAMGLYIVLSGSVIGAVSLVLGLLAHAFSCRMTKYFYSALCLAIVPLIIITSSFLIESHLRLKVTGAQQEEAGLITPSNVVERLTIWRHYTEGSMQSFSTFIMGSPNMPDRASYPSAHNYYLDLLYSFGLLGLAPIVVALVLTSKKLIQNWSVISHSTELQALIGVVFMLVVVDNLFKVGLRQPYPGLFSFFLWGVLLAKLQAVNLTSGLIAREVG